MTYRNTQSKEEKRAMERMIAQIKIDFESEIAANDKRLLKLNMAKGELLALTMQTSLYERTKAEKVVWDKQVKGLTDTIIQLEAEIEEIRSNKIYDNAFEWRFEFPEVLNDDGDFIGFDLVIGNPPYVSSKGENFNDKFKEYANSNYETSCYQIDTYILFIERSLKLQSPNGYLSLIIPNAWLNNLFLKDARKYLLLNMAIKEITNMSSGVFEEAVVDTIILIGRHKKFIERTDIKACNIREFTLIGGYNQNDFINNENCSINITVNKEVTALLHKIEEESCTLESLTSISRGVGVYHKRVGHTKEFIEKNPYQSIYRKDETFVPYIRGKNVRPYSLEWNNNSFISYGKWLAEPRDFKYFEGKRIIIRQIPSKKLIATFIEEKFIIDQSVFIAKFESDNLSVKSVLAIISSKLMSFYFRYKNGEFDILFPKIKLQHFKLFPINVKTNDYSVQLEVIIDQIQDARKTNVNEDTLALESEIDQLVYQLYGLTDEEIKIVENS
jgi:adenine-specific DNA-methyltransferase